MPTVVDAAFVFVLIVLASLFEHYVFWPRFRADIAAGDPNARLRGYKRGIIAQWGFTLVAALIWWYYRRSLADWRLTMPAGWQLGLGIALALVVTALATWQVVAVSRLNAERRAAARPKLGKVAFMLPHTNEEHRWFMLLSLTAGICEELLYRGYLVWVLTPWLGVLGAFAGVTVLFGIGHAYQGWKGGIRATLAGAAMGAIVLATGWLVPAMIVHALVDASSGTVGYLLLRDPLGGDVTSSLDVVFPPAG